MQAKSNQAYGEIGALYGLSCRKIGNSVIIPYIIEKIPIHQITELKTLLSTLNRKATRPPKKRNRERCSNVGNVSTAQGIRILSTPSEKNARILARFSGLHRVG